MNIVEKRDWVRIHSVVLRRRALGALPRTQSAYRSSSGQGISKRRRKLGEEVSVTTRTEESFRTLSDERRTMRTASRFRARAAKRATTRLNSFWRRYKMKKDNSFSAVMREKPNYKSAVGVD